jgi:rubrerythrin
MTDSTKANLLKAFVENAAANRRYLAYGQKAQDEGFPGAARLFRAVARSEAIQAANHLKTAGAIQATASNIRQAFSDEHDTMIAALPGYISQAEIAKADAARIVFAWSRRSEQAHARLYEDALAEVDQGRDCQFRELHICSICGFLVEGDPPDICPNCGVGKRLIPAVD